MSAASSPNPATAIRLLAELRDLGITLWSEQGQLRFRTPKGQLTPALKENLTAHRSELLALLDRTRDEQAIRRRSQNGPLPLSIQQRAVWAAEQFGGARAFLMPGTLQLDGLLDPPALQRAFQQLCERHEALRTAIQVIDEQPMQVVLPAAPIALPLVDLSALGGAAQQARLEQWLAEESSTPFELSQAPLLRLRLIRLSTQRHVLCLTLHHIIADGWSIDILLRELDALYRPGGSAVAALPAALGYADFSVWQAARHAAHADQADLTFWRQQLAELPPPLELSSRRLDAGSKSFAGAAVYTELPAASLSALRQLATQAGRTLFAALSTSFAVLLYRYSGQRDLLLGAAIAGRGQHELEHVIGLFAGRLPLRLELDPQLGFAELTSRIGHRVAQAFSHAEVPAERIIAQALPDSESGRDLFQVMIALQNVIRSEIHLDGLQVQPIATPQITAKSDLALAFEERDGRLLVTLEYATALFEPAPMQAMLDHWLRLTEAAVAEPLRPVAQLPMLADGERAALLDFPRQNSPALLRRHLWHVFEGIAAAHPERTALSAPLGWDQAQLRQVSYRQLQLKAQTIAAALHAAGVRRGDVVALAGWRSIDFVEGVLGIAASGATYLPLSPEAPAARISEMRQDSGARVLLGSDDPGMAFAALFPTAIDLRGLRVDASLPSHGQPVGAASDHAHLIFTSGSTGRPKGVAVSHANMMHFLAGMADFPAEANYLCFAPFVFDASILEIWLPLLKGAQLVIAPPGLPDLDALAQLIETQRIQVAVLFAGLFQSLCEARPQTLAAMDHLISGGDRVSLSAARALFACEGKVRLYNGYGPTETTIVATMHRVSPADLGMRAPSVPIGGPLGASRLYVLDAYGELMPHGAIGELYIGGDGVAAGYINQPQLSAERFIHDPFAGTADARMYRSGDLVRWRDDRTLEFHGRADRQVKIRGFRIELAEIEAHISEHPAVAQALVEPQELDGHKQLVAYAVVAPGAQLDAQQLHDFLAQRLPDYMVPHALLPLDHLPLTVNGKLDRSALPKLSSRSGQAEPLPDNEAARALSSVWCALLKVETVSADDNFYHLGGDSIIAMQMAMRLSRLGWDMQAQALLRKPTLRAQLGLLKRRRQNMARRVHQGPLPLTPIQQWFFKLKLPRPQHWNQAVRLALDPALLERLPAALAQLERNHDALRLRFQHDEQGWQQQLSPLREHSLLQRHRVDSNEQAQALIDAAQQSLDLQHGPVWTALVLESPSQWAWPHLLLLAHHLVVDGVSWRVLLEHLNQALHGEALLEPALGYADWAVHLAAQPTAMAASAKPIALPPLPHPHGDGSEASTEVLSAVLPADFANQLLGRANTPFRSEPTELMLTGVLLGLQRSTGQTALTVALERHGRDAGEIDLSSTVGWFTRIQPVHLELPSPSPSEAGTLDQALLAVKQAARSAPNQLDPHPTQQPAVAFNYLGRIDHALPVDGALRAVDDSTGACVDSQAQRPYAIEIVASADASGLRIDFRFSRHQADRAQIQAWLEATVQACQTLLERLHQAGVGGRAPCDFPLAGIATQASLDALLAGCQLEPASLTDLLPASAQQRGMLLESLAHPGKGMHVEQFVATFDAAFDATALEAAWARLISRHDALRTRFVWPTQSEPLCAVLESYPIAWRHLDWRADPSADDPSANDPGADDRLGAWLDADRAQGFDHQAPPLRLTSMRRDERHWLLIWTYHHALLDGWSVARLLDEAMQTSHPDDAPAHSARSYASWLAGQDRDEAAAFWQAYLDGDTLPAPLGQLSDEPQPTSDATTASVIECQHRLGAEPAELLQQLARRHGITLAHVASAAVALLQAWASGQRDVIHATTVSGRPSALEGSESWIGLFINSLPLRIEVPPQGAAWPWMQQHVAERAMALAPYEWCSGSDIHRWSGRAAGKPLSDALLVFENYPRPAQDAAATPVTTVAGHGARTHFPVTLLVVPEQGWRCELIMHAAYMPPAEANKLLAAYVSILQQLAHADADIATLLAALPTPPQRYAPAPRRLQPPQSPLQLELCTLWETLFTGGAIGIDDHFFELGGHSLLALDLLARLRQRFGREVSFAAFVREPTVAGLAGLLSEQAEQDGERSSAQRFIALGHHGTPIYLLPGASGNPMSYLPLARALDGRMALQAGQSDLHTRDEQPSMEQLAAEFAAAIVKRQPSGPVHLAGHSFGAVLAYAIAQELQQQGRRVASLIVLDQAAPDGSDPFASYDEAAMLAAIAEAMAVYFACELDLDAAALRALSSAQRHRRMLEQCKQAGIFPASTDDSVIASLLAVYRRSADVLSAYRPASWSGPLSLIRNETCADDSSMGWDALCQHISTATASGSHIGMITDTHVGTLADLIVQLQERTCASDL
ncbi:non-ribosomal peptide synthetase [Dyella silvatica]|uniref:non-ribosomal peptide synthetase n=1 Tax=Dyella silvatica TaxID=2992128 RepID=UPI00224EAB2E|nr:non-ribosomal peptide synthetase [Dyella silvatica]